jgi:hypothetical protein
MGLPDHVIKVVFSRTLFLLPHADLEEKLATKDKELKVSYLSWCFICL